MAIATELHIDSATPLFLGIDGGGTKTIALLGVLDRDHLQVIGEGQGGATNPRAVGYDVAFDHLRQAILAAFQSAVLPARPCYAALCIAGVGRAEEIQRISAWAEDSDLFASATVISEAEAVLAATNSQSSSDRTSDAIALICGTGSLAWGRAGDGSKTARSGGWGYLLGDEGSGYWLGLRLLQCVCRIADQRDSHTAILDAVLEKLQLHRAPDLIEWCYGQPDSRQRIASLAPLVFELASTSSHLTEVINEGARQLSQMVGAVARQLNTQSFTVSFAGSVASHQLGYRNLVCAQLQQASLNVTQSVCVSRPAIGAINIAAGVARR